MGIPSPRLSARHQGQAAHAVGRTTRPSPSRPRAVELLAGLAFATVALLPAVARAGVSLAGAHVAAAGGIGADASEAAARFNLDAGFALRLDSSSFGDHDWAWPDRGWLIGASATSGFGRSPTYVLLEGGLGHSTDMKGTAIGGAALSLAGVVRVDPSAAPGVGARVTVDLFFIEIGIRVLCVVGAHGLDGQAMLTAGLGRF
jgi:hypothetical protein